MQIITKFITNNAVDDTKIRLRSNQYLRSRNNANSADLNILKTNATDQVIMASASNWLPDAANVMTLGTTTVQFLTMFASTFSSGTSNDMNLTAGASGGNAINVFAASIVGGQNNVITTTTNNTFSQTLKTGNNGGGASGSTTITTGTGSTAANRGTVALGSYRVALTEGSLNLFSASTDPTTITAIAGDVYYNTTSNLLKYYNGSAWVTVGAGGSMTPKKELFTLSSGDITNQYIDVTQVALTDSIDFLVKGGGVQIEGSSYDYTVSYTGGAGGKTRIAFANDLATGGLSALVSGDIVVVKYLY